MDTSFSPIPVPENGFLAFMLAWLRSDENWIEQDSRQTPHAFSTQHTEYVRFVSRTNTDAWVEVSWWHATTIACSITPSLPDGALLEMVCSATDTLADVLSDEKDRKDFGIIYHFVTDPTRNPWFVWRALNGIDEAEHQAWRASRRD